MSTLFRVGMQIASTHGHPAGMAMPPVTRRMLTQRHSVSMPPGASGGAQKRSGGPAALHITVARGPFDYAQGRLVPRARRARGKPSRYIGSKARGRARGGQARHGRVNLRSLRSVGVTNGDGERHSSSTPARRDEGEGWRASCGFRIAD